MTGPEEQYGSDISQYPDVEEDGTLRDIAQGTPVVSGVSKTAEDIYGAVATDYTQADDDSASGFGNLSGELDGAV